MSASNDYLAVLAHVCNCSSSISERIARKVLHPQYRGKKQRHYAGPEPGSDVCFSTLCWMVADCKVVIVKLDL